MRLRKSNNFYFFIAALFIGMLFVNFKFFRGSSRSYVGISDATLHKINSEKPVIIKKIHVVPGQEIKAGDLLVSMESNLLEIEMVKLENKIDALKKEKIEKASLVQSKIDYLKAEGGIKMEEVESAIEHIKTEMKLNQRLTGQFLESADGNGKETEQAPQKVEIKSLQKNQQLHQTAMTIKIKEILKDNATSLLILENEIDLSQRELKLLQTERDKLKKYAGFNGVVENVLVHDGEEINAFSPILEINPKHPTSITGYIVGTKAREVAISDKVMVSSYNFKDDKVQGEVIGFGAISELPEILQKSTAVKAFGRQVFIRIPEENNLATGEKVLIK